jgi:EspG family
VIEPLFVLTPRQLDVLWHELELGRLPYPLDVPSVGATAEERGRLRAEVLAELGGVSARLANLLRLLADHDVAVDAVAHFGRPVRALAASDHQHGVLAVIDSGAVGLTEIRPTALARSIVEVLPENTSGPGTTHTFRLETLRRAVALHEDQEHGGDPWGNDELDERAALVKAGLPAEDAKAVAELAAHRLAGGQFGLSYSESGAVRRAPTLITWFDTPQGRYLMVHDNQWLSIASTDNDRIGARIAAELSTVAMH